MPMNAQALASTMVSKWTSQVGVKIPLDQGARKDAIDSFKILADIIAASVVEHIQSFADVNTTVATGIVTAGTSPSGPTTGITTTLGAGIGKVL